MTFAQYLASCVVSIVRCFLFSYRIVVAVGQGDAPRAKHSKEGVARDISRRGGAGLALLLYIDRNALHVVCKAHALKATVRGVMKERSESAVYIVL